MLWWGSGDLEARMTVTSDTGSGFTCEDESGAWAALAISPNDDAIELNVGDSLGVGACGILLSFADVVRFHNWLGMMIAKHRIKAPDEARVLAAAERVAQEWDNHGKARYFADVYQAVNAELIKPPRMDTCPAE
jgi:hypothetical protein